MQPLFLGSGRGVAPDHVERDPTRHVRRCVDEHCRAEDVRRCRENVSDGRIDAGGGNQKGIFAEEIRVVCRGCEIPLGGEIERLVCVGVSGVAAQNKPDLPGHGVGVDALERRGAARECGAAVVCNSGDLVNHRQVGKCAGCWDRASIRRAAARTGRDITAIEAATSIERTFIVTSFGEAVARC